MRADMEPYVDHGRWGALQILLRINLERDIEGVTFRKWMLGKCMPNICQMSPTAPGRLSQRHFESKEKRSFFLPLYGTECVASRPVQREVPIPNCNYERGEI